MADNEECMQKFGLPGGRRAQTAFNAVIGMGSDRARSPWKGKGVLGPEAFNPDSPIWRRWPLLWFPV